MNASLMTLRSHRVSETFWLRAHPRPTFNFRDLGQALFRQDERFPLHTSGDSEGFCNAPCSLDWSAPQADSPFQYFRLIKDAFARLWSEPDQGIILDRAEVNPEAL